MKLLTHSKNYEESSSLFTEAKLFVIAKVSEFSEVVILSFYRFYWKTLM